MAAFSQKDRPLALTTPLGEDTLLLIGLQGREGLSQLFSFQLDTLGPETPIAFDKLLQQPVSVRLEIPGSGQRTLHGIISRITQQRRVQSSRQGIHLIRYRLEMVPTAWLLTRRFQTRMFQYLSVPDILKQVLETEWALEVDYRIQQRFDPRVRCVQYRETDFDFISRLMEEEGIHYFFEHRKEGARVVLSDAGAAPTTLATQHRLEYDDIEGGERNQSRIFSWEKTQQVRASEYTVWDHCFELPGRNLQARAHIQNMVESGKARHQLDLAYRVKDRQLLEIYDFPGNYAHRFDGIDQGGAVQSQEVEKIFSDNIRTARLRMAQEAAQSLQIEGGSNVGHLAPGYQFDLTNHFDAEGAYLVTQVTHQCRMEGTYLTSSSEGFTYENQFSCLPVQLPFKPPRVTPRPTVLGTQTATVVGPSGSVIHCDKYGRVKVRFHWDRRGAVSASTAEPAEHDASCWIRVSQTWAGKGFGSIHIPRVGQEVIVDFLDGDPDKPIIVGTVYNAEQMPPYALPDHRSHYGMKSQSVGGNSDEFSHLTFEEYKGGEHVHMHSQKDMTHSAENHLIQNVGNEHHVHVGTQALRQVGSLPGVHHSYWIGKDNAVGGLPGGSGSGGGAQDPPPDPATQSPYYSIAPSDLFTGWARNQDVTYGWHTGNTCGLYTTLKLGVNLSTTINPYVLDEYFSSATSVAGSIFQGLFMIPGLLMRNAMGAGTVVIGVNNTIHYGRKIDVHYGNFFGARKKRSGAMLAGSMVFGTLFSGLTLLQAFQPSKTMSPEFIIPEAVLTPFLFHVWAAFEGDASLATYLRVKADQVAASLFEPSSTAQVLEDEANEQQVQDTSKEIIQSNDGPALETSDQTYSSDTSCNMVAPLITLTSAVVNLESPPTTTGIVIQALGTDGMNGTVAISGTGAASLTGGAQAYVQCVTEEEVTGKVTIDCGAAGTICLQSGLTQEPNSLTLNPEGVSIQSLEKISASVEENSITIDPATISLSSGPSSITITPEGITISCGPCSVAITPEGITVSGPTVAVSGDAEVGLSAPMITVGP
ncbi:MAG: type VI secretion system tip protein TssI/VgrG [Gemmataceae bacterium]